MSDDLLIRLLFFFGLFVLLTVAERLFPRRKLRWSRPRR